MIMFLHIEHDVVYLSMRIGDDMEEGRMRTSTENSD